MEWSKLKNIVLVILLCTNLALLAIVARQELQSGYRSHQARQEALQFLSDRGVTVTDEDQVPDRMTLLPQKVERDLKREEELAGVLLGSGLQVQDRGAGIYRYFNDSGYLQFHGDGSLQGEFAPGTIPGDTEQDCLDLLSRLDMTCEVEERSENGYTFRQWWEEAPLFNQQVTVETENGSICSVTAFRRLVGRPQADGSRETVTVATALVNLYQGITELGDVCSRIDGIVQGYASVSALNGPMTLTPVWRVETDTGAYQLDLVTGVLTRAAE